jgi:uncharacterized phage protein (TIGR02218 family)
MTYAVDEISIQDGKPVFFYEIVNGAVTTRMNSSPDVIVFNTFEWEPSPISHSEVTQSSELAKDPIKLSLPRDDELALALLTYVPDNLISITIFRKHRDSADAVTYWKGRMAGVSNSEQTITIECESIFTSLRRPGLRALYQKNCRHALYGDGCTLDKADFAVPGTILTVDGSVLTVAIDDVEDVSLATSGWYAGGMVLHNGVLRYIKSHVGSEITISRAFFDAAADDVISLYPGCNRTRMICHFVFNNLNNFGGFPWIPSRNPFVGAI